jgi:hypothetical protein
MSLLLPGIEGKQHLDRCGIHKARGLCPIWKVWLEAIVELGGKVVASPCQIFLVLLLYKLDRTCIHILTEENNFGGPTEAIKCISTPHLMVVLS